MPCTRHTYRPSRRCGPDYRAINAQVLHDVLHRLDKAFAACFRRVKAGAHPGYPRVQGHDRSTSFTYHRSARMVGMAGTVVQY